MRRGCLEFRLSRCAIVASALYSLVLSSPAVFAGGHTWDVYEVFSNADGTIQFIELRETGGGATENGTGGKVVSSVSTGKTFTIVGNVVGNTSLKYFLIATQSFADLPGAPTPDRIIPAGSMPFFFNVAGDQVKYSTFDTFTFGPVPTDGILSMNRVGGSQINSPTNYAGQTGSVDASGGGDIPGDADGDGDVDLDDYYVLEDCFDGPDTAPTPTLPDVTEADCLAFFDQDDDSDIDLVDFHSFQQNFDIP